jgi:hypothetical protein
MLTKTMKTWTGKTGLIIGLVFLLNKVSFAQDSHVKDQLADLEKVLKQYNPLFVDCLMAPINFDEYLHNLERVYKTPINPKKIEFLRELYDWHNGTNEPVYIRPYSFFYNFELTLNLVQKLDSLYHFTSKGLFPIFISDGSGMTCITLFDESPVILDADPGGSKECLEAFDSMKTWIELCITCYESGIFSYVSKNNKRYLTISNLDKYFYIYKKLNPKFGKMYP